MDDETITSAAEILLECLIGTIRREFLDHVPFWNSEDLKRKLSAFRHYYNNDRVHASLDGQTPTEIAGQLTKHKARIDDFRWMSHCHGLVQLPMAA